MHGKNGLLIDNLSDLIKQLIILRLSYTYMRPEVKSSRFEMSNRFEMLFRLHGNLHGDFTAATFETMARF